MTDIVAPSHTYLLKHLGSYRRQTLFSVSIDFKVVAILTWNGQCMVRERGNGRRRLTQSAGCH